MFYGALHVQKTFKSKLLTGDMIRDYDQILHSDLHRDADRCTSLYDKTLVSSES